MSWVTQVSTGLLSVFAYRAVTVFGYDFHRILLTYFLPYRGSFYPTRAVTRVVWAVPRSLATTGGIIVIFFSCGYLDVSVPRVPLISLWIQNMMTDLLSAGFPHSDIDGSSLPNSSPSLFAVWHVLLQY